MAAAKKWEMVEQKFLSGDPVFFSGELVKESTRMRRHKVRYFRLVDGALYNYRRKGETPTKVYSVIDGKLSLPDEDGIALHMADGTELVLRSKDSEYTRSWADALMRASKRKIGRFYGIHGIIGAGAFAEVRLAYVKNTGEQVAVKIMRKNKNDQELMTAVNCELKFVSRNIVHKNIVATYDVINTREILFIVMEYMKGGMLYDVLAEEKMLSEKVRSLIEKVAVNLTNKGGRFVEMFVRGLKLTPCNAVEPSQKASIVMKSLLEALGYLHENGIVHRDVKPENVLCSGREWPLTIKLADFGLADVIMEDTFGDKTARGMYGTPFFVAPEVIRGEAYGPAVDIWSSGVLLYNMLSGQLPFEGGSLAEVLKRVKAGHVEFPEKKWGSISDEAKNFIRGLLRFHPGERLSAKQALADPWFTLAQTRKERILGHDMSQMMTKEAKGMRSSVAIEDIEGLLRDAVASQKEKSDSGPRLFGFKIYRQNSESSKVSRSAATET
ncbi:hypothetical protein NDN08_005827 [Rhodosorus marinus]|uniref:Non-specific serine/threonine protein kinase n=1 Tax=Rhodosorus marinus TaxID=101924 RepID=A0AAV8V4D6_9RHOD|nr:hypothetical protein NDN08_005827 [Rhodosorus marinus]